MKKLIPAETKTFLSSINRYKDFHIFSTVKIFKNLFANKDFDIVQLHCFQRKPFYNIGFCGSFSWNNNILTPLDGDSYTSNTLVYGYHIFTFDKNKTGLDIIVDEENW